MTHADIGDELSETASEWYVRRQDADWTSADERDFQLWLQAEPAHALAYRQFSRLWADFSHIPRPQLAGEAGDSAPSRPAARPRHAGRGWGLGISIARWPWPSLLAASLVVCVFLGGGWYAYEHTPSYSTRLSAARGQIRALDLPDGSRVTLNMGSRLRVDYYPHRREVVLEEGNAFFEVAPDARRPFTVASGRSAVRVLGTVFEVRAQPSNLRVNVVKGRVEVRPDKDRAEAVVLSARQGLRLDSASGRKELIEADADEIAQWRNGQLVFRRTPLADAVQELSRYLGAPVALSGPRLDDLRVSGFASTGAPRAFIESLPDLMAVRVQRQEAGGYLITAR